MRSWGKRKAYFHVAADVLILTWHKPRSKPSWKSEVRFPLHNCSARTCLPRGSFTNDYDVASQTGGLRSLCGDPLNLICGDCATCAAATVTLFDNESQS